MIRKELQIKFKQNILRNCGYLESLVRLGLIKCEPINSNLSHKSHSIPEVIQNSKLHKTYSLLSHLSPYLMLWELKCRSYPAKEQKIGSEI